MRCIIAVFAAVTLSIFQPPVIRAQATNPPAPNQALGFDQLPAALRLVPISATQMFAQTLIVQQHLPLYQQWRTAALSAKRPDKIRVDVILQVHEFQNMTYADNLVMHFSQWRTRQLLDSLAYDIVGIEGFDVARVTPDGLLADLFDQIRQQTDPDSAIDTLTTQLKLIRSVSYNNGMTYYINHPRARLLGFEDSALHCMHGMVLELINNFPADSAAAEERWTLHLAVSSSRAELAISKMLATLARENRQRGAIIIGYSHRPEVEAIWPRYGMKYTIYETLPNDRLPADWWK